MRLPPWAVEAIRNGVADVARKASDPDTIKKVRQQATELLRDLPDNASKSIDSIVKSASETARGALDQGRSTLFRWAERQNDLASLCCNASGTLLHAEGSGLAIGDQVLQLGCDLLRGDCLSNTADRHIDEALARQLDLPNHRMLVANNLDAAVKALTALPDGSPKRIVMHRAHAIRLPSGIPLPDAFGDHSIVQRGGVGTIHADDFRDSDHAIIVMADDGNQPLEAIEIDGTDIIRVAVLPIATVENRIDDIPSIKSSLESGFDLVVIGTGPMSGGVEAGILAGKSELIAKIESSNLWPAIMASRVVSAMTLSSMITTPSMIEVLIETSEDNLRSRAERMATRLTAQDSIKSCQISSDPAEISARQRWQYPSRQLRLRNTNLAPEQWAASLLEHSPAIITSIAGDELIIDLRWVPASSDSILGDSLAPSS